MSRCPSKQSINWWAKTHEVQSSEAQSKHLATAKTGSLALQAVQVAEFHPLFSERGVVAGVSIIWRVEKSLKRLDEDDDPWWEGGDMRQSALQTGQLVLLSSKSVVTPSFICCLSQHIWQRACRQGRTVGKTENESPTPQTAHLVANPGLETPLLLVLELQPGKPPLGGRLLVPLLPMLKLSYCIKRKRLIHWTRFYSTLLMYNKLSRRKLNSL